MKFDVISAVPDLLSGAIDFSIVGRARLQKLVEINLHNLHAYGLGNYKQIDDYPYGGSPGMVLRPEPLANAILDCQSHTTYDEVIFFTPDGEKLNQSIINQYSLKKNLLIVCGHYKGIDQRIRTKFITKEYSIGDFVISGGEIAAAMFMDAVIRMLPGAINNEVSALTDSFMDGLLAPPLYTRPANFMDMQVPPVLMEGNHKLIEEWLMNQALENTQNKRPDLLNK